MKKILLIMWLLLVVQSAVGNPPDLMLLQSYEKQDITGWVMSEKLDGIRGYWDGKQLYTRQNQILTPPHYFLQHFPPFAIDGELFSERGQFEKISSIIRSQKDTGWETLALHVFDVPNAQGDLHQRLATLAHYLNTHPTPYIKIITQIPVQSSQHLQAFLTEIEKLGGEGVVVRNPNAPYEFGKRSSQILKFKTAFDEECTVIEHHKGKGQFENILGALTCENHRGRFKIGSGFNLEERTTPPPIGSVITYKYRGLTNSGKPRFATYWREKK